MDGQRRCRGCADTISVGPLSNDSLLHYTHQTLGAQLNIRRRMLMCLVMMVVDVKRQRISRHALNIAGLPSRSTSIRSGGELKIRIQVE